MIQAVMELRDTTVWDVMVPRVDIVAVEADASFDEVARTIVEKGYSRLPVYEETIDNVIGIVHAREVLRHLVNGSRPASLREIIRPAYFVPDTKRVSDLLAEMRRARVSMAIVVDEYGGTAGLVTIEDLVEEVVGEIVDEFDTEEERVQRLSDDEAVLDARVSTEVLNELFGVRIESDEFETVGGFIYHHLGKVPNVGDEVRVDGLLLRVLSVLGRRIKKVYVGRLPPSPAE
jgi:CBS domain containing-hemolysin-like protein